jgi:hypothetical protein
MQHSSLRRHSNRLMVRSQRNQRSNLLLAFHTSVVCVERRTVI